MLAHEFEAFHSSRIIRQMLMMLYSMLFNIQIPTACRFDELARGSRNRNMIITSISLFVVLFIGSQRKKMQLGIRMIYNSKACRQNTGYQHHYKKIKKTE